MRRNLILAALGLCLGIVFAALAYAPYLPRLLLEGYPQATWPAPGAFARVAGVQAGAFPRADASSSPTPKLLDLFGAAEGRALLVAHDGKLVMEHYAAGIDRDTRLNSYSMVKSLIGALALKAIAEGKLAGLDTPIGQLLPELEGTATGALALCRLLDMRSGILFQSGGKKHAAGLGLKDLEDSKLNVFGPMARLHMSGLHGVESRLTAPRAGPNAPGDCAQGTYSYQNVNTALVGEIIERAYGKPLQDVLSQKIWKPAGASDADWRRYDTKLPVTPYCCLYARPIDWVRVGQYLMTNGTAAAPFLPETLWRAFMGSGLTEAALHEGVYAHFTYHNVLDRTGEALQGPFTYFFGSRGQTVYLMPEHRLVVVRFGGRIQLLHSTLYGVGHSIGVGDAGSR